MQKHVLIIGAGPVGLVSASLLSEKGISVTMLETAPSLPHDLRASTFHPPTLDMLDRFGVVPAMIEQGLICPDWQFRDRTDGVVATFELGLLKGETNHPYRLQCEQWRLGEMLLERLQRNPLVTIVFGAKVTELQQTDNEVIAKATFADRTPETFRADFCIGADGIGSIARQTIGAEFAGRTIPEIFLTISTTFDFSQIMPDVSNIAYISDPTQWYVLIRTAKVWRALFPVNPELNDEAVTDPEAARQLLQTVWRKPEPYEVSHRTGYRVHERVASYYTKGRIAIAGDAAHVNNPLGGMGLNGGIHDAFNLASAIEAFFNKEPSDVLGRYERQRRKVALDVVQQTTLRNRAILNTQDPAARTAYYDELRRTVANEATHKEYLMRTSMISSLRDVAKID